MSAGRRRDLPVFETTEGRRLADSEARRADWKNWGPYVSDRAWGTVREDYSAGGAAWEYFPHDHARSRAYRWNEDGLGGFSNRFQNLALAVGLWNERDPEFELIDALRETFEQGRYFDVFIEYAKAGEEDILCRITAVNRGPDPAPIHILPHLWFRNTWSWRPDKARPELRAIAENAVLAVDPHLGERWWYVDGDGPLRFTENETNAARLFGDASLANLAVKAVREQARYSVPALNRQRRTRARLATQTRPQERA